MKFGKEVTARLGRVFTAQVFNQIATILVQIGLVPALLHAWGTQQYGIWLLLSAVPTYLTFSDFGFTFVAKNEMVMQVAQRDHEAALRTYHSIFALLCGVAPIVLGIATALIWGVDFAHLLKIPPAELGEARGVLTLLIVNVIIYQFFLMLSAGVRCENRAATESTWVAASRLGEGLAIGVTALAGGSLLLAALSAVVIRTLFCSAVYRWLRRASPWLYLGWSRATRAEVRRLFHPALGYMFTPVSQALLIQGPVLLLGAISGPVTVVLYATSRTLTRLGTAGANMLNNTLITEYSAMAGRSHHSGFRRLFRLHMLASVAAVLAYSVLLVLLGRPLMHLFTHGKVPVIEPFFAVMVAAVAAEMLWTALFTPISAINGHVRVTHWLLGLSMAGIGLCYPA
ncbi:MAG TPA: teichoic acid transporter, partial [Sphingomonas sp.]|nr:teichoic acid transporter [Sphingomonas sp.]